MVSCIQVFIYQCTEVTKPGHLISGRKYVAWTIREDIWQAAVDWCVHPSKSLNWNSVPSVMGSEVGPWERMRSQGWGSRERGQCPYEREHSSLSPPPTLHTHVRLQRGAGCLEPGSGRKGDFTPKGLGREATHLGSGLPFASHSIWKYSSKGKATCSFDCFVMVGTCGTKW